jgi:hypothetical protein
MRRIDSANRAVDLFGVGKDGFKAAIAGVTSATELTPAWFNAVQEAVVRTIEAAGIELSQTDFDQFTEAVLKLADQKAVERITALVAVTLGGDSDFAATITDLLSQKERAFASGTRLLFQQSVAPVGWTKDTSHDNKALRVVSGAAGSGGSLDFTAAFVNGSVGAHALTIEELPAHGGHIGTSGASGAVEDPQSSPNISSVSIGGGLPHTHSLNLDVKYVDVIIASKD